MTAYCEHRTPTPKSPNAADGWCEHPHRGEDPCFPPCAHAKAVINGLNQFIGWGCRRPDTKSIPLPAKDRCTHKNGIPRGGCHELAGA